MNPQAKAQGGKVRKVMHEFRTGSLKSSSGQKVTNPKQAVAIALSEQRRAKGMNEGGMTDKYFEDRAAKARKEAAPSMVPTPAEKKRMQDTLRDEAAKKVPPTTTRDTMKGFARGGALRADINKQDTKHGKMDMPFSSLKKYAGMREGGKVKEAQMEMRHAKAMKKAGLPKSMVREEMAEAKKYARGGGIESRGKTKGTVIKMAGGGSVRGGGCEQRGKTKGKFV